MLLKSEFKKVSRPNASGKNKQETTKSSNSGVFSQSYSDVIKSSASSVSDKNVLKKKKSKRVSPISKVCADKPEQYSKFAGKLSESHSFKIKSSGHQENIDDDESFASQDILETISEASFSELTNNTLFEELPHINPPFEYLKKEESLTSVKSKTSALQNKKKSSQNKVSPAELKDANVFEKPYIQKYSQTKSQNKQVREKFPTYNKPREEKTKASLSMRSNESQSGGNESLSEVSYMSIEEPLSQPSANLSHKERLLWLQERRNLGLYVQCDSCDKWRYLEDVKDPLELPELWYCHLNPDRSHNTCGKAEHVLTPLQEESMVHSLYNAGSVVWAKMHGYPWWPAMVDDCPDTEQYFWLDGYSDIPTSYNVVFFDSLPVSRAWLKPEAIMGFKNNEKSDLTKREIQLYGKRLDFAKMQATKALLYDLPERLQLFCFLARWKGRIVEPKVDGNTENNSKSFKKGRNSKKRSRPSEKRARVDSGNKDNQHKVQNIMPISEKSGTAEINRKKLKKLAARDENIGETPRRSRSKNSRMSLSDMTNTSKILKQQNHRKNETASKDKRRRETKGTNEDKSVMLPVRNLYSPDIFEGYVESPRSHCSRESLKFDLDSF